MSDISNKHKPGAPIHCAVHKAPGEVDLMHRRCEAMGCFKVPIFGSPTDGIQRWCNTHRCLDTHVDLMHRTCTRALCVAPASYGVLGDKCPTHCREHMVEDMVLMTPQTRRRLDSEWEESFLLAVAHLAIGTAVPNVTDVRLASDKTVKSQSGVEAWIAKQQQLLEAGLLNGHKALCLARLLLRVALVSDCEPEYVWHRGHVERVLERRQVSGGSDGATDDKGLRGRMQRSESSRSRAAEEEQEVARDEKAAQKNRILKNMPHSGHAARGMAVLGAEHGQGSQLSLSMPAQFTSPGLLVVPSLDSRNVGEHRTADSIQASHIQASQEHQQAREDKKIAPGRGQQDPSLSGADSDALQDVETLQRSLAAALQACQVRKQARTGSQSLARLRMLVCMVGSLVRDLRISVMLIVVGVGARDYLRVCAGTAGWRFSRQTYQPRDLRGRLYGWIWRRATGKDRRICAWCKLFFRQSFAHGRSAAQLQPARTAQIDAQYLTHRGW